MLENQIWWEQGSGRALAIALSVLYALVCLIPLFYGIVGLEVRCGDVCGSGSGWLDDPDAWQWTPLAVLGAGTFIAAIALAWAAIGRSPRLGRLSLFASVVCWAGLGVLAVTGP